MPTSGDEYALVSNLYDDFGLFLIAYFLFYSYQMGKPSGKDSRSVASKKGAPVLDAYVEKPKWYAHTVFTKPVAPPTKEEIQKEQLSKNRKKANKTLSSTLSPVSVDELKTKAIAALDQYNEKNSESSIAKADKRWIQDMLNGGTLSDKVSALTLQVKNHPEQSLKYLDSLLAIAKKKGRRETNTAVDALRDLFCYDLLPPNRKLRFFASQPWVAAYAFHTTNPSQSPIPLDHAFASCPDDLHLAMWALEDGIKLRYAQFLEIVEDGVHDPMVHIKRTRLNTVYDLLVAVPEAEEVLLALLVNKLGDSERKIASKAQYLLNQLLEKNPGMKIAVVKEVERLLFRPHIKHRAQYYGLIFLNEMLFNEGDYLLAQALIGIYFTLFKVTITQAIPTFDDRKIRHEKFLEKNQKRLKEGKGKKAEKARKKAAAIAQDEGLSKKMLGALLTGVSRALPYARAVPAEDVAAQKMIDEVLVEHTELLFRLVNGVLDETAHHFAVVAQALTLLYQVIALKEELMNRFYTSLYRTLLAPDVGHNSKVMLYLNVLFKAIKNDTNSSRAIAFIKRLLQVAPAQGVPFLCASIFLISEASKNQSAITAALKAVDTVETDSKADLVKKQGAEEVADEDEQYERVVRERVLAYDPNEGDPAFARAHLTALWEVMPLTQHYHPSVAKFSCQLVTGQTISYAGNPLTDFTRMNFLDKFVNKNAKKPENTKLSASAMRHKPKVSVSIGGATEHEQMLTTLPVGSENFRTMDESLVPETDKFFYQYFREKAERDQGKIKILDEDEDAFAERLMEEELLKMQGISRDDAEELNLSDDDFDMSSDSEIEDMLRNGKSSAYEARVAHGDDDDDEEEEEERPAKRAKKDDSVTFSTRGVFDDGDDDEDDEMAAARELGLMGSDDDDELADEDLDELDDMDMDAEAEAPDSDAEQEGGIFGDTFASADEFAELLESAGKNETALSDAHSELLMKYGYSSGRDKIKKQMKEVKKKNKKQK